MLVFLLTGLVSVALDASSVTYKEITVDLRGDIENLLTTIGDPFTVGNLVRYGFHTCVTGCDGCVNLNNPSNAGIYPSFDALNALFVSDADDNPSKIKWSTKIDNLADFWSISSTVGNMIAIPDGEYVPAFKFWTGRTVCATTPNQTILAQFPDPIQDLATTVQVMGKIFDFSMAEYVAIIGGHTLGFAHSTASGFDTLSWTATPTILDNSFYQDIMAKVWYDQQAQVNKLYEFEGKDGFFMFNSDICIYKNVSNLNTKTGQVPCGQNYASCPIQKATEKQVTAYAYNQTLWFDDYAAAWNKMELTGCNENSLTPILP